MSKEEIDQAPTTSSDVKKRPAAIAKCVGNGNGVDENTLTKYADSTECVDGNVTPIIQGTPEPNVSAKPVLISSESMIAFNSSKIINCCVHGMIKLDAVCLRFVDTPEFQRLRDVRQCGTVYYVYPGATHSRFEHSIGVAHLSKKWIQLISLRQPQLSITQREVDMVTLSGLLHDIGHGPFSHMFDGVFLCKTRPKLYESGWCHEKASIMLIKHMISKNNIDLSERDVGFISGLIMGDPSYAHPEDQKKKYLYDIVSNSRHGLDVDKLDYLLRDSYHLGMKLGCMIDRILEESLVIDDEICFQRKIYDQINRLYQDRHYLHKNVYTHQVVVAIEYMVIDAFIAADKYLKISSDADNPTRFSMLTDFILLEIERSTTPELEASRKIVKDLRERKLYRCVKQILIDNSNQAYLEKGKIAAEMICAFDQTIQPDDMIINYLKLNYGMKDKNPCDYISFYSRWEVQFARKNRVLAQEVSSLVPRNGYESTYIRIYCRDVEKYYVIQQALKAFLVSKNKKIGLSNGFDVSNSSTPTRRQQSFKNTNLPKSVPIEVARSNETKGDGSNANNATSVTANNGNGSSYFHNKARKKMKLDSA